MEKKMLEELEKQQEAELKARLQKQVGRLVLVRVTPCLIYTVTQKE